MLVDSHCHLDRIDLTPYNGDLTGAVAAARDRGVDRLLCISVSTENRQQVLAIAKQFDNVYATTGIHPLDIDSGIASAEDLKQWALADPKIVGLGETGLDYYYSDESKLLQQTSFVAHLQAAGAVNKPVVVHTRNAKEDTLALIGEHGNLESSGVLHCFTEDWDMARRALDLNYYISISGIVTFKNADALREVARQIPLDKLLVETDSPYLAPVPHRGKRNEPKYVREVAEFIAQLRSMTLDDLALATSRNFDTLFQLNNTPTN